MTPANLSTARARVTRIVDLLATAYRVHEMPMGDAVLAVRELAACAHFFGDGNEGWSDRAIIEDEIEARRAAAKAIERDERVKSAVVEDIEVPT